MDPKELQDKFIAIGHILDNPSRGELSQVILSLQGIIIKVKEVLDARLSSLKGDLDHSESRFVSEIQRLSLRINNNRSILDRKIDFDIQKASKLLKSDIERVERLIPDLPDLAYLENRIEVVRKSIPKPLTAEQVRDKLETLNGDERLDKSAIKGLEEALKKKEGPTTVNSIFSRSGGGVTQSEQTSGVSLTSSMAKGKGVISFYIPVQDTPPEDPWISMLWVDTSGS